MQEYKFCPFCRTKLTKKIVAERPRSVCEKCGWIYYMNPLPAVACLVSDKSKGLLIIKRAVEPYKGEWCLPGGFVEMGETLPEAGARELKEETGLVGIHKRFIGAYVQKSLMYRAVLLVGMELKVKNPKPIAGDDAMEAKFFSLKKLPDIPFESHKNLIEEYRERFHK